MENLANQPMMNQEYEYENYEQLQQRIEQASLGTGFDFNFRKQMFMKFRDKEIDIQKMKIM